MVKGPSKEFLSLPPDIHRKIEPLLNEYPVRLGELAKKLGVRVLLSTLPRGISGQIGQEDGVFVIRVNRHEAKHRQRFTLAHEISHYLLHREMIVRSGGWSENVLLRSGQPASVEFEANRLASDLIIPTNLLERELENYSNPVTGEAVEELAKKFGVSTAAMEIKLNLI